MWSFFTKPHAWLTLLLLAAVAGGGCTQVQIEETKAAFNNLACQSDNGGGNNTGGGGSQQPPAATMGTMDTYVVQIFELYDGQSTAQSECETCLADRSNCFFEKAACVCGDPVATSPARLPEKLQDLRIPVPAKYGSLYCMQVLAVQRTSESEQCQCDSAWWAPPQVRLCALSRPYAASSFPVALDVQCTSNRAFSTCLGQPQPAN